ncbi:MAG TPA: tannase/feruloyl esterase family alpha/beta hydrolase [Bryobacteraceae bacterium]|nr:tannase/feruloyl esterase family alpha/beta hydrolase [Bryobacteraceae bacterium]
MVGYLGFLFAAALASAQTPCERLKALSLPNIAITSAESLPVGQLPAHCRVAAVLTPSSDSHIEMALWLPEKWNGKFQAVGNGGWAGTITFGTGNPEAVPRTMSSALREGYATASNDTGHKGRGGDASFALGHPEKLVDFAHRAVHQMTVKSKAIIGIFYGRAPRLSYWNGCSTGGRQGLMAAQRYPEDFDGIVAGAPANYWTHLMTGIIAAAQATHKDQPGNLPREKLILLHDAVLQSCDALDGVKDGVLEDPTRCKLDPVALQCKDAPGPACLTAAQVEAVRQMYQGAVNPRTKQQIYPGMAPKSELGWDPVNGLQPLAIAESHFRYIVFKDPTWSYQKLNLDAGVALADKIDDSLITAINPNLQPFFARGGKLIQYHGWNDQQISALNSVNYYQSVAGRLGSKVNDSYRLFMAPGMAHCSGGEGPNQMNPMGALERWRESNVAPDQIPAVHVTNGVVDRIRPLCPYPQIAVYNGIGTTNDAANFSCKVP